MSKNNLKLLSDEQLIEFKEKYTFQILDSLIVVRTSNFNRPTMHDKNKGFFITLNNRKLTITPEAINMWENNFPNTHLVDVQHAINRLFLMYQNPNVEDIKKILNDEI